MPEDVRKIEKQIEKKRKKEEEKWEKEKEKYKKKSEKIITFLKKNKDRSFEESEISNRVFGFFNFFDVDNDTGEILVNLVNNKNSHIHRLSKEGYFLFLFDYSDYYYYYKD